MPKTPTKSTTSAKMNPYSPPTSLTNEDHKPNVNTPSPKKPKANSGENTNRRPWTNEEYTQLFEHVVKNGALGKKVWESAVEGRTSNQAYQAWLNTLGPFLRNAINTRKK